MMLAGAARSEAVPPSVTFRCTPEPQDCKGWYRTNVSIDWTVLPSNADKIGCNDATYVADTPATNEFCSASDPDDPDAAAVTVQLKIKVDKTPPAVTGGQPARGADFNGWYNHPVAVAFSGSDQTSGIASCTSPTYGGPDSGAGLLFGTCVDVAGNVSTPFGYGLSYDATAPPISALGAVAGDRSVTLRWRTTAEAEAVEVTRTPGRGKADSSVVFRGPGSKFEDTAVSNGERYAYQVRIWDVAGNAADQTVATVPHPHLVSPARLKALRRGEPPLLKWTPVRRATYYNVQLFRDGKKVLSAWPEKARYQLKNRWTYRDKRRRLVPGKYRWLVFPGYGLRSKSNYGERLGPTAFRIRR
jgi:hypothetical protein